MENMSSSLLIAKDMADLTSSSASSKRAGRGTSNRMVVGSEVELVSLEPQTDDDDLHSQARTF